MLSCCLSREVPELVNSLTWVLDSPEKMVLYHYICQLLPDEAQAEFDRVAAAMLAGGKNGSLSKAARTLCCVAL